MVLSPSLFGGCLAVSLERWQQPPNITLLQYCDDLLISASKKEKVLEATKAHLNFLGEQGYRVSASKAQIAKDNVTYLGYKVSQGKKKLLPQRKEAICQILLSKTKRQLRIS